MPPIELPSPDHGERADAPTSNPVAEFRRNMEGVFGDERFPSPSFSPYTLFGDKTVNMRDKVNNE